MSRRLIVLFFMTLLFSPLLVVAEPQESSSPSPPEVKVELNGPNVVKLCERKNFTLWIDSTGNISIVTIMVNTTKGLDYNHTKRISGNLSEYLNPKPSIINYTKGTIIRWEAKNEAKNLTRGSYSLVFELEPNAIINATISATVIYEYMAKQQNATSSVRVTVEKPELSITSINCSVLIKQDHVNTTWNITIRNNEEFNIPNVNVTCESGSGLSCTNPYRDLNLSKKENKPLQFNVNVTRGLNSLEKEENLIITFIVKCKNYVINKPVWVPSVLPKLSSDLVGLKVNILSPENLPSQYMDISIILREKNTLWNYKLKLSKGKNESLAINETTLDELASLGNTTVTLCVNGSLEKNFFFNISRIYKLSVMRPKLDHSLPYLIIVKNVSNNVEVRVDDKSDYPTLQIGDNKLIVLFQDMFIPSWSHNLNIRVTYLNVTNGEIKLVYTHESFPISGGVGTLAIIILVVLFALVISTRRKVKKVPTRLIEEAPEHIELG